MKRPDGVQLPYGLSWAQWCRLPDAVQTAVSMAALEEHTRSIAEARAWWDIVEKLEDEAS